MNFCIPLKLDIKAKSSSSYNDQHIEARLANLAGRTDEEAQREIAFLKELQARRTSK